MKYILQDIPTVLSKANQGLATLEKYRARLDQVSARLTALEFEGGGVLYDVLSVLQRAELVTRMAAEVERYIIELGSEGRLIEMQLEETVVGVMADRAALVRDYSRSSTEETVEAALAELARARPPGPARLRPPRRAARLRPQDEHPRLPCLAARLPRARPDPAPAAAGRPEDHPRVRRPRGDPRRQRRGARGGRGRGGDPREGHPRGPAQTSGGRPRRPLPAATDGRRRRPSLRQRRHQFQS